MAVSAEILERGGQSPLGAVDHRRRGQAPVMAVVCQVRVVAGRYIAREIRPGRRGIDVLVHASAGSPPDRVESLEPSESEVVGGMGVEVGEAPDRNTRLVGGGHGRFGGLDGPDVDVRGGGEVDDPEDALEAQQVARRVVCRDVDRLEPFPFGAANPRSPAAHRGEDEAVGERGGEARAAHAAAHG